MYYTSKTTNIETVILLVSTVITCRRAANTRLLLFVTASFPGQFGKPVPEK